MTDSPLLDADGLITVEILSSGNRIPDTVEIHAVRTRSELNRVAEALIILSESQETDGENDQKKKRSPIRRFFFTRELTTFRQQLLTHGV